MESQGLGKESAKLGSPILSPTVLQLGCGTKECSTPSVAPSSSPRMTISTCLQVVSGRETGYVAPSLPRMGHPAERGSRGLQRLYSIPETGRKFKFSRPREPKA